VAESNSASMRSKSRPIIRSDCAIVSRAVKVALLDQKTVAGIVNLYASAMLHSPASIPARASNN